MKNQISIIILVALSITLILSLDIQRAYALSSYTTSLTDNAFVTSHTINGVSVFTSIDSSNGNTYKTWRASDGIILYTGDSDNACTTAGLACTYNDMDCSGDVCYLHADVTADDRVVKLIPSTGVDTIAVATGESSTSNEYLLFNGALWIGYTNGANEKLRKIDINTFNPADFVDTADLNVPLLKPIAGQVISGTGYVLLGGSTLLDIINTSTMTVKCQFGTVDNYLGGVFHKGNWYVGEDSGSVRVINNSCTLQSTITSATLNTCGTSQDVESNGNDLIFVACDSTGTNNRIVVYNTTSNTVSSIIPCAGNSAWGDSQISEIDYSSAQDAISCSTFDTDSLKTILLQGTTPEEEGEFCDDPANANILICRVGGNGEIGSAGAFIVGNITQGTGVLGIGCSMGLVDCTTDSNPQTNGLGLLIFIASIFVVVGMFFASIGARDTFQLPVFIWVVIIIALSAFFTITGLIDPVFLIVSIIAIIALAAPKIINTLRGGSFGGGSTA